MLRAWGLQMASDVSMCHKQQFCGWDIAYKRLEPTGNIHVVGDLQEPLRHGVGIFASNTYGISGGHPQELLQKHQDVITPEYPHRPCVIISGDLHCVPDDHIWVPFGIGSGVVQGSTGWRYNAFSFSIRLTKDFARSNAVHTTALTSVLTALYGHRASARDLTECQIRSRDPPPQNMVQLCLVIQEVWDDIPQARISDLIPFMPWRWRVVLKAHGLSQW